MKDLSTDLSYKPIINSRRSELMAWIFSISLIVIQFAQPVTGFFKVGGILLAIFFLLSAIIISLGNWTNRKTVLRIREVGIDLDNGIKMITFKWQDIIRIEVFTGRFNDKISLITESGRMNFDIAVSDDNKSATSQRFGFQEGDEILKILLDRSKVSQQKVDAEGYVYYSKE